MALRNGVSLSEGCAGAGVEEFTGNSIGRALPLLGDFWSSCIDFSAITLYWQNVDRYVQKTPSVLPPNYHVHTRGAMPP